MNDKVLLRCQVNRTKDRLLVSYSLDNRSDQDWGVFNRLQGIALDGGTDFSPDAVFTDIEDSTLLLMKMALHVPKGLHISAYIPPHATLLAANSSMTETLGVPIPVNVRQPFKRAMLTGEVAPRKPLFAKSVELRIGLFPLDECKLVAEHPAFEDVMTVVPPRPAVRGQVILSCRQDLDAEIEVRDYVSVPWS